MADLITTLVLILLFSNPLAMPKLNANFSGYDIREVANTKRVPIDEVNPNLIKKFESKIDTVQNYNGEAINKTKAFNIKSEHVIQQVSENAVKNSKVLIDCDDSANLCDPIPTITPTPTPTPIIFPKSPPPLPTTTPTPIPTITPEPIEPIIPIPSTFPPKDPCLPPPCYPVYPENRQNPTTQIIAVNPCMDYPAVCSVDAQ